MEALTAAFACSGLVHHDIIIEKPRMEDAFDTDRKMAIETRVKTMSRLSSEKMLSLIYHTAWPGLAISRCEVMASVSSLSPWT
jgi:hypothetical protein